MTLLLQPRSQSLSRPSVFATDHKNKAPQGHSSPWGGLTQPATSGNRAAAPRVDRHVRAILGAVAGLLAFGPVHAAVPSTWVGNYRLGPGHVVAIADWEMDPSASRQLLFTDFRSG